MSDQTARRLPEKDEPECCHQQPDNGRYGCELIMGHPGPHGAFVGFEAEVQWPNSLLSSSLRPALEALIALWRVQLTTYPPSDMGMGAAAAVKVCADELAAVLKSTQMSEGQ